MKPGMMRREDYLKLIYTLSGKGEVRGADLADELNVKRPTVCIYLKKLVELGDITMDQHRCVFLTAQGRTIAESTLAMADACAIEHSISPETYSALKQLLNERQ